MKKKVIRKLKKNNKRQEKILVALREVLRKERERQKIQMKQNLDAEESKYDVFDSALEEKQTEQDPVIEKLEEQVEVFQVLNKKQEKVIKKLKKKLLKNTTQADKQRFVVPNKKFTGEIKKFFQRAGEVILKALPRLLNTAVTLMVGKFFSSNRKRNREGTVT